MTFSVDVCCVDHRTKNRKRERETHKELYISHIPKGIHRLQKYFVFPNHFPSPFFSSPTISLPGKRWPGHRGLHMALFSEFTNKEWRRMNLYETCAMLPGFGVGCTFWKPNYTRGPKRGERSFWSSGVWKDTLRMMWLCCWWHGEHISRVVVYGTSNLWMCFSSNLLHIFLFLPPPPGGSSFLLNKIDWQTRPFEGTMSGTTYFQDKIFKENMAPIGKSYTGWNFCYPPKENRDRWIFRPPFPSAIGSYEAKKEGA